VINLLPPELKETYTYGRRNRALAHWLTIMALCLVGAALLTAGGYLYLNQSIDSTDQQIADVNKQLQSEDQTTLQKQVTDISNNLKLAVQVLSKEILFSKLLKQLAAVTPSGAVLTNLSITQAQGGLQITAETTNYKTATQLQVNLAAPSNQIFSQADIEGIDCSGQTGNPNYPCAVTIRTLFAKNNPFLFINNGARAVHES
jgi:Tfp pilus assembly protein PilN